METIILYLYHIQVQFTREEPAEAPMPEAVEETDRLKDATENYVEEDGSTKPEAAEPSETEE
jgi:hypothetical protein